MFLNKSKIINSKILVAFSFTCFYIYNYTLGLELTPDSFSYLSGAKNILQSNRYIEDCNGGVISIFPPLYSFYLMPFLKFGEFSSSPVIFSSVLLFITSILLLVYYKKLSLNSWYGVIIFVITISFLFSNQNHLLSETLFIPLFILWYYVNDSIIRKSRLNYFFVLLLEVLLICTRYSAILIIASYYLVELFFDFEKRNELKSKKFYFQKYLVPIISFFFLVLLQGMVSNWRFPHISNVLNSISTGFSIIDYLSQFIFDFGDNIFGKALSFQLERHGLLLALTILFFVFLFYISDIYLESRVIYFVIVSLIIHVIIFILGAAGDPLRGRFLFWLYIILLFNIKVSFKPNRYLARYLVYFLLISHLTNDLYFMVKRFNRSITNTYSEILSQDVILNSNLSLSKFERKPSYKYVKGEKILVYPCYKWQL